MIKLYLLLVALFIPFIFTYNGTIVDLYKECLNNNCLDIPKVQINKEIDSSKPMTAILIGIILMFSISIVFAKHLSR